MPPKGRRVVSLPSRPWLSSLVIASAVLACRAADLPAPGPPASSDDDDGAPAAASPAPARDAAVPPPMPSPPPMTLTTRDQARDGAGAPTADAAADRGPGPSDGAPTPGEAAAPPPSPPAGCAGVPICDDFEGHALGAAPGGIWRTMVRNGKLAVDGTRAFSGARSVLATVAGGTDSWSLLRLAAPQLPLGNNNLHGRMMFFVAKLPTTRVHWFNVWARGRLPAGISAHYAIGGLDAKFILNYFPGDCWRNSVAFPEGRWACLQWQFDGSKNPDGTTRNEMRAWLDGKLIGTVVRVGSGCVMAPSRTEWAAPTFEDLRLGWERASNPVEMWIDDVAVDTRPLACPTRP